MIIRTNLKILIKNLIKINQINRFSQTIKKLIV